MTVTTLTAEAPTADSDMPDDWISSGEIALPETTATPGAADSAVVEPRKTPARKTTAKKGKTLELTLTVTGTADGEWHAELKHGTSYLARNLAVAAAAVSRAAKELHEDLSSPIDELIEEARTQQAAKVAALEAELDAARRALAELD